MPFSTLEDPLEEASGERRMTRKVAAPDASVTRKAVLGFPQPQDLLRQSPLRKKPLQHRRPPRQNHLAKSRPLGSGRWPRGGQVFSRVTFS